MAITFDSLGVPTGTTSVLIEKFSELTAAMKQKLAPAASAKDPNLNKTVYECLTAPAGTEPVITVSNKLSAGGNGSVAKRTVTLNVAVNFQSTDGVTGEVTLDKGYAKLEFQLPIGRCEIADVDRLLASTYGLVFTTAAAGVRNTDRLDLLLRGYSNVLG